jgi:hypothetical protein
MPKKKYVIKCVCGHGSQFHPMQPTGLGYDTDCLKCKCQQYIPKLPRR